MILHPTGAAKKTSIFGYFVGIKTQWMCSKEANNEIKR